MNNNHREVILMIVPNLNYGGAQRVFYNLSMEFSKTYRVVECVFNLDNGYDFKTGQEIISLDVSGGTTILSKLHKFYLRCKRLRKLKKQLRPIACISHLEGADYVNILSRADEKIICCLHGSKLYDENIKGLLGWIRLSFLIPFLYKRADSLITVSHGILLEMTKHFGIHPRHLLNIPNFFYSKEIKIKSSERIAEPFNKLFDSAEPVFVTAGRLVSQKNQIALINLAAHYKKRKKAKWIVIGDGELLPMLCSEAEKLGLKVYSYLKNSELFDCDIYFLGYMENPYPFIAKSDWFILTSSWEGFPMVIGEAMACGAPIISTDCQTGPREMLSDDFTHDTVLDTCQSVEYGILMPLINESTEIDKMDRLVDQLIEFVSDKSIQQRYRELGLQRIQQFSPEVLMSKWMNVIKGE